VRGIPPALDLSRERASQQLLAQAISRGLLESANDCSEGGLAVALAESSFDSGGIGLTVDVEGVTIDGAARQAGTLFSESATRVVASVQGEHREAVMQLAAELNVPAKAIGTTGGSRIRIAVDGRRAIDVPAADAEHEWKTGISRYFERRDAVQVA
jgi:phosphoribosylformylglycinamidine synthase